MAARPKLDLTEDGTLKACVSFGVSLYSTAVFSEIPEAILGCYEKTLEWIPEDDFTFYVTATMSEHKKVTRRALNMLGTWLKPGAPAREYIAIELNDAEQDDWAASRKFEVMGGEEGSAAFGEYANVLEIAFPFEWGTSRPDELASFVTELCETFPFRSGLAGYAYQCSRYFQEESETHAWAKSMRHRGVDIPDAIYDPIAVGQDAIRGVNWLTILDKDFVKRLGGRKKLATAVGRKVDVIDVSGGVILRAGKQPEIGDTNRKDFLPAYQAVYGVVAPLMEPAFERFKNLDVDTDDPREATESWMRRFEK